MKTRTRVAVAIFAGAGIIAAARGSAALASSGAPATARAAASTHAAAAKAPRTPKLAGGYGTFWENDCTPDCADGHVRYYPSLEVLWGSAAVQGHPADRRYTKLTVIFTGKTRPPVYVLKNGKLVATYPLTQTFPAI